MTASVISGLRDLRPPGPTPPRSPFGAVEFDEVPREGRAADVFDIDFNAMRDHRG